MIEERGDGTSCAAAQPITSVPEIEGKNPTAFEIYCIENNETLHNEIRNVLENNESFIDMSVSHLQGVFLLDAPKFGYVPIL